MKFRSLVVLLGAAMMSLPTLANVRTQVDTTGIYGERKDSLEAAVFVDEQDAEYLPKGTPIRAEVISSAGLRKMACCTLADSFENSASVTVGYSDAVTGARQIRLLGLSGIYTEMMDEARPIMRGLASPFGLSYVPGQWLESIQIAKGAASVVSGVESMTGQINLEYRKPTDEKPLFVNASFMSDTQADLNIASCLQPNEKWSTAILGHVSGNFKTMDHNGDGYMDDPKTLQFNLANRWFYLADSGVQLRFGFRAIQDQREGGQSGYNYDDYYAMVAGTTAASWQPWGSDITNRTINGYVKVGIPVGPDESQNIAVVADYTYYNMNSCFGSTKYLAGQNAAYVNFLYLNEFNEHHKITAGLNATYDRYNETLDRLLSDGTRQGVGFDPVTNLFKTGVFGEYTFTAGEKFTAIAGVCADWYNTVNEGEHKVKLSPRVTLKYAPDEHIVLRFNGGRGLRYASPLTDNIGILSTGKLYMGDYMTHVLEDAWTFGGNLTYYFHLGASDNAYFSFDYFSTRFRQQLVVDYEYLYAGSTVEAGSNATGIAFYLTDGRRSFTDNYQFDFNCEPFKRFTLTATFRYTNAKIQLLGNEYVSERPLTSRYKGVLNLQYATNLNKWIFDFTASVNGPSRVYSFMKDDVDVNGDLLYPRGMTPVYPLLYAQVTKRFKGVDIYIGGENLTNYRQKYVILGNSTGADGHVNGNDMSFDASAVWGPLMGIKIYAGIRYTLWKH
ncbi:MAG: TonB-dependent receptor plug domain-containing protein [Porphyromonadaceae bacterium]|nr:TonB-dependent receptor plug domain-containing protein [Porphyromonadaceae bacterium]